MFVDKLIRIMPKSCMSLYRKHPPYMNSATCSRTQAKASCKRSIRSLCFPLISKILLTAMKKYTDNHQLKIKEIFTTEQFTNAPA